MKRILCLLGVVVFLAGGVGCSSDFYAKSLIQAQTSLGNKTTMELTGSANHLLKRKIISSHRRFVRPDKTEIDVWTINTESKKPAGTVVLLHGLGESKTNYLGVGRKLSKRGYDVILIDLRCHGRSSGQYITYGAREKHDVKAVVDTLRREKKVAAGPLCVFGVTFGAATAIQYAAMEPGVRGVICIAPWRDTVTMGRRRLIAVNPAALTMSEADYKAILDKAAKLGLFDPEMTSAYKDAGQLKCPVYIIHGMLDLVVPLDDSKDILSQVTGPRRLKVITPGPEQLAVALRWELWVAEQIEKVAKGKLDPQAKPAPAPPASTQPKQKTKKS